MYAIVETITPEKARVFLKGNTNNRNLNQHAVRKFASDIKNGLWQENGEAIVVAKDGTLKDGQHRLNAVCLANKPIRSLVVYDVDNTVTEFDRGMNRTLPHLMQLNGYSKKLQRTTVTGAINCLLRVSGHSHASDAQFFTVMSELQEQCMTMADLITSSAFSAKAGCFAAGVSALHFGMEEEIVRRFFRAVDTGFVDSSAQFAAVVARNYLQGTAGSAGATSVSKCYSVMLQAIEDYTNAIPRKRAYDPNKTTITQAKMTAVIRNLLEK